MNRNIIIYLCHAAVVIATAYFANLSNLLEWYYIAIIGLPLVLATTSKLSDFSYTVNARILLPLSIGLLCVSLYHYFPTYMSGGVSADLVRLGHSNNGATLGEDFFTVNSTFIDAVSVLYAVCAAFLLWKGLNDFDELKQVLHEEANEVRNVTDFSSYFLLSGNSVENSSPVHDLRVKLRDYIENMLAGNKVITNVKNETVLSDCLRIVSSLKAFDLNDQIALAEIMKGLSRITVLRSRRTVCTEKSMSPFILVLIVMMSGTMVASFFGKATGVVSIDYAFIFLLPSFYASIFMTLLDLSSPFDGYWQIKLKAVEETQKKLDDLIGEQQSEIPH